VSVLGHGSMRSAKLHCGTKQLCVYTGSCSSGGGAWPNTISHDRSSKLGFIVSGMPKSFVKNDWVGTCRRDRRSNSVSKRTHNC
jgi:hypothetical protein